MEKYRLVQERKAGLGEDFLETQTEKFPEVRITQQGKPRNYISYAMNLFVRDVAYLLQLDDIVSILWSALIMHSSIIYITTTGIRHDNDCS